MEIKTCNYCNLTVAVAEEQETHKGELYHSDCWKTARYRQLLLLLRLNSHFTK